MPQFGHRTEFRLTEARAHGYDSGQLSVNTRNSGKTAISIPSERPKGAGKPCIVVIAGPELGRCIDLGEGPIDVGRNEDCVISVPSQQVSRRHASIQKILGHYTVADLDSTNGTFVNDQRIKHHKLNDGDKIRIGKLVLKYMESNLELQYHMQILSLASTDPLTKVFNKRHFDESFNRNLQQALQTDAPLSLIVFDIDHFKQVNDTYGHPAGDTVLKGVCEALGPKLSEGQELCRVGGEEFAVLLPNIALGQARTLAETLRSTIENTRFAHEGQIIPVTISAGVAERESGDESSQQLYKRADEHLYRAKRTGRNRVSG